jgi:hypothetical protein
VHNRRMKRAALISLFLLASPLLAVNGDDCTPAMTHLRSLYELRSLLLKTYTTPYDVERFANRRIEELRDPLPSGGYRWVRWMRPANGGPTKKEGHNVRAVQGRDEDQFEASADHAYAVRVAVPAKRSLLKKNNPVYVADIVITADGVTKKYPINRWMNPDTSQTFDLNGIADRVEATARASTAQKDVNEALVEIQFRQAVADDDPANPAYSTIRMLQRVKEAPNPVTVDAEIAALERQIFPSSDSLPILTLIADLRRADDLMKSSKPEEQEKGNKLLHETLRRIR